MSTMGQINKAVKANNEHCKTNSNKQFWVSSAGPDGAGFFQANDCATTAEKGIIAGLTRFFEQYKVPFTPKRQAPTTDPGGNRGGGFVQRPIP